MLAWGKAASRNHPHVLQHIIHTLHTIIQQSKQHPQVYTYSAVSSANAHDMSHSAASLLLPDSFIPVETPLSTKLEPNSERIQRNFWPKVDLLLTIGGDGLIVHLCREVYRHSRVPRLAAFGIGSNYGFLTPFRAEDFEFHATRLLSTHRDPASVIVRDRLFTTFLSRNQLQSEPLTLDETRIQSMKNSLHEIHQNSTTNHEIPRETRHTDRNPWFMALNEVALERADRPKVCEVDIYCNRSYVTR
eukprot:CAMPEP_0182448590 /NCGR_PEP_ID=MMETSP1172-20130603/28311_1 /TAXON_ID=708627 /ORGANISM="Timspurckia oligopyrenoides, Strain CCMP3278" /LENGTH=245 /DNA_ID=CAMNT_0024645525 /DNA_START=70 /DNA_END=804 /DNA_ORIENTATION=+